MAHFYETIGYERYDIVAQLDADHAPHNGYLTHMLRPFTDPGIGYVAAPNLGDANLATSWAARARLYGESVMNGSLQAGYNSDGAPICIGSHYAIRTAALRASGGIGPELAEDYTTTVLLQANGWRGAFAYDAIASGYGPETFADLVIQDFQWAKSLTRVLFGFLPRYFLRLRPSTWPRFLLSVLWYPMLSLSMVAGLVLPIIAVATDLPMVRISYTYFLLFGLPPVFLAVGAFMWLRRREWLRPRTMRLVSWETVLFQFARWPWTLIGCVLGFWETITGRESSFVVTPKGERRMTPALLLTPYAVIIAIVAVAMRVFADAGEAVGYHYFLLLIGTAYTVLIATVTFTERSVATSRQLRTRLCGVVVAGALMVFGGMPVAGPAITVAFNDVPELSSRAYVATVGRLVSPAQAKLAPETSPVPTLYVWTVAEGESLWYIAVQHYDNGLRWVDVFGANRTALSARSGDGTILWPGDRLVMP